MASITGVRTNGLLACGQDNGFSCREPDSSAIQPSLSAKGSGASGGS